MAALTTALLAVVLVLGFRSLISSGRETWIIGSIWSLLFVEMMLYPSANTVPPGPFHPEFAGISFRLMDVVVLGALTAHISLRGLGRFRLTGVLWAALLAWLGIAAAIGVINGNPLEQIAFELRAVVYLGAILLTASIPAANYLRGRWLPRLIGAATVMAVVLLITDTAGVAIDLGAQLPDGAATLLDSREPLDPAGRLSTDAVTIFVAIGAIALGVSLTQPEPSRRLALMLGAAALLATTVGPAQRAAFLGLAVSVTVLALLALVSSRRLTAHPTEWFLASLIVAAFLLGPTVISSATAARPADLPFERQVATGISGPLERLTTEERIEQFEVSRKLIAERPVFGWGLGKTYRYFSTGRTELVETDVTHNIATDVLLRSGLVGLLLLAGALAATLWAAARSWFAAVDVRLAGLGLGVLAAVSGLIAKGMVESILENYRLAIVLALLLGMLLSVGTSGGPAGGTTAEDRPVTG